MIPVLTTPVPQVLSGALESQTQTKNKNEKNFKNFLIVTQPFGPRDIIDALRRDVAKHSHGASRR